MAKMSPAESRQIIKPSVGITNSSAKHVLSRGATETRRQEEQVPPACRPLVVHVAHVATDCWSCICRWLENAADWSASLLHLFPEAPSGNTNNSEKSSA